MANLNNYLDHFYHKSNNFDLLSLFENTNCIFKNIIKNINNNSENLKNDLLYRNYMLNIILMMNSYKTEDNSFSINNNKKLFKFYNNKNIIENEYINLKNCLLNQKDNSIFIRTNQNNIKAIIFGIEGTSYSNGAFLFDINLDEEFPKTPPNISIISTGNDSIIFNPIFNLNGKVDFFLSEWEIEKYSNKKFSIIYDILLNIRKNIMNVSFIYNKLNNQGSKQLIEEYINYIKFNNIKVCIYDMILYPPKGFEIIIKTHFFLKKEKILKEVSNWIEKSKIKNYSFVNLKKYFKNRINLNKKIMQFSLNNLIEFKEELEKLLNSIKIEDIFSFNDINNNHLLIKCSENKIFNEMENSDILEQETLEKMINNFESQNIDYSTNINIEEENYLFKKDNKNIRKLYDIKSENRFKEIEEIIAFLIKKK